MLSLIKLEWIKNKTNPTFWILLVMYVASVYVVLSSGKILMNATYEFTSSEEIPSIPQITIYEFPNIWHNLTFIGSFVRVLLAIVVIVNISGEVSYKTLRQNIIDGLSTGSFLTSKVFLILFLSFLATMVLVVMNIYLGMSYSENKDIDSVLSSLDFVGAYFLELFGYLCFALFVTLWVKKSGLSLMIVLVYSILFEPFLGWVFLDGDGWLVRLLPINALDNLIRTPINLIDPDSVQQSVELINVGIALGWILCFVSFSYVLLSKRDI